MMRILYAALEMLAAMLVIVPVFWVLNLVLFQNVGKSMLHGLFACYLAAVYVLVGLPNVTYIRFDVNLNWVPFLGLLVDGKNSLLNIMLFVPLGVLLPVLCHWFRFGWKTVVFGLFMSFGIELLQLFTLRATDVNDLITNTLGAGLGFCIYKILPGEWVLACSWAKSKKTELYVTFAATVLIMFFVHPFLSAAMWEWI